MVTFFFLCEHMILKNVVVWLRPLTRFVMKSQQFTHHCFCTVSDNVNTVGRVKYINVIIVFISWIHRKKVRDPGVPQTMFLRTTKLEEEGCPD